jgi:uroporphyrinogen III methyltransferase/synthase
VSDLERDIENYLQTDSSVSSSTNSAAGPLGDSLTKPLTGVGILVTRYVRQSKALAQKLEALGATVFKFPLIELRAPDSWAEVDQALLSLERYDWIVFASTNAVDFFLQRLTELNLPVALLKTISLAAIGTGTADSLNRYSLDVAFSPKQFSARHFVKEFCLKYDVKNLNFLWPKTNIGNNFLKESLEAAGASVEAIVTYETHLPSESLDRVHELKHLIESGQVQIISLTSSQAARNLKSLLHPDKQIGENESVTNNSKLSLPGVVIATIGAETKQTADSLFDCEIIQSSSFTIPGLVECIAKYSHTRSKA